ncbi:MAG: DUF4231 domain-containing protein [Granulosicoccus sp.]|nr:DUF4231 domain-containing protein [Granulosicoccus sp.]
MSKTDQPERLWKSMTAERYLEERVNDQLAWYSKKSTSNKNWHFRLQLITLVAATLVPVVSLSFTGSGGRIFAALTGSVAAIAAGVVALYQFRTLWVDYRATAERINYEKFLFLTGSEPYNNPESFSVFVNRIEKTISQENRGWHEMISSSNGDLTGDSTTATIADR